MFYKLFLEFHACSGKPFWNSYAILQQSSFYKYITNPIDTTNQADAIVVMCIVLKMQAYTRNLNFLIQITFGSDQKIVTYI